VPLISGDDIRALLEAAGAWKQTVIVGASHDRQGTNALLLRPTNVIAPAFGPPSVGRHVQLGLAAGAHTVVLSGLRLALDIDTPDDLQALARERLGPHVAAIAAELLEQHAFVG